MPVYSHSRLSTFEKCPLQYRFRYIDKIKRDTQGIEAFMGNRVHEALEKLYRDRQMTKRTTLEDLIAFYHAAWKENFSEKVTIVKTEFTADHYRAVGERCLADYYRSHEPFDQGITLGLEERIQVALDAAGRYLIQGYIDRLARDGPGEYAIHDYKTSSSLPGDADLRKDRQLTLYQMAVARRFPDAKSIRLVWHYLAHGQEFVSDRTPAEVEEHRRRTVALIDTVEAARDFPARESALCRWCEYRDICPAQKHLVAIERLPKNEYLNDPGAALVDRLAALQKEKRSVDGEIAKIEEAIRACAAREGATALRGTDHRVRLKEADGGTQVVLSPLKAEQIEMFPS